MKKIELREKEMDKYNVIKNVVSGRTKKKRASILLNCSIRQIDRLIIKYKEFGKEGFIHGNRTKTSGKKTNGVLRNHIHQLYTDEYYDFSISHFREMLITNHNINLSYPTIRSILNEFHIISNYAHKKTIKIHKKRLKELKKDKSDTEVLALVKKLETSPIVDPKEAHPRLPKAKYKGEIIEMDACDHLWFGNEKVHLHGAIDACDGRIVGLYFSKEETLNSYYNVSKQMFLNHGIPAHIKTDKRTVFEYISSKNKDIENDTYTQYSYMCHTLGINLTCSSIPESKPHIERLWGTLQKRLIPLLRRAGVCCIDTANVFIQQYIKEYNDQFAIHDNNITSVYDNDSTYLKNIDKYLSVISKRIVQKGHCIKYKNSYYGFSYDSKQVYIKDKTELLVLMDLNGELMASVDGIDKLYDLELIPDYKEYSKEFDAIPDKKEKKKRTYRPPANHPWRKFKFSNHITKQEHKDYSNY